jgi:hypothetical protein
VIAAASNGNFLISALALHAIDEAVLAGDSTGPVTGQFATEGLWLTEAGKWVPPDIFD